MLNRDVIKKLDFKSPNVWLATWFGCGLIKPAPGTWGTLGALPYGLALLDIGGWPLLLGVTIIFFALGLYVAKRFDAMVGSHDNSAIVVDEVVGVWLAMLPICTSSSLTEVAIYTLMAFSLFRLFDILKPWPVGWADKKLPGAWGVMIDDVLAGIIALVIILGVKIVGFG